MSNSSADTRRRLVSPPTLLIVETGCLIGACLLGWMYDHYRTQHSGQCGFYLQMPTAIAWGLLTVVAISVLSALISVIVPFVKIYRRQYSPLPGVLIALTLPLTGLLAAALGMLLLKDAAPYTVPCF